MPAICNCDQSSRITCCPSLWSHIAWETVLVNFGGSCGPKSILRTTKILLNPGTTKNKKGRTLPIYGDMREPLRMEKEIRDTRFPKCSYVFHHDGHAIVDYRKAWAWASACKRADVPGLLFHDLRRSAIRNMRLAGIPDPLPTC